MGLSKCSVEMVDLGAVFGGYCCSDYAMIMASCVGNMSIAANLQS